MPPHSLPASVTEPLYVRLKIALRDLIGDGLQPGDRLPSEPELCRQYGLSRITVRQALSALENEGVIERHQGRGTFVATPKRDEPAAYFGSFTEEVAAQGRRGSTRLVSSEVMKADLRVAERLRISPGTHILKVRRVRMADRQPICYQVSYVPHARLRTISPSELRRGSLYERLEAALGEPLHEADESIQAMLADPYRAELLQIRTGAPLLVLERLTFTRSGLAVEYNRSFYNAQLVRLSLRSRRAPMPRAVNRLAFRDREEAIAAHD
jgi:GntR family transcriptional regulator